MREILFRGKMKTDNGEYKKGDWAFGDLVRLKDGEKTLIMIYGFGEVIPETVGQYTGLTDKNGNKIFEGDILEFTDLDNEKSPYLIKWDGVSSCYKIWTPEKYWDDCNYWYRDRFEIIGNIFDNPELFNGTSYDEI